MTNSTERPDLILLHQVSRRCIYWHFPGRETVITQHHSRGNYSRWNAALSNWA